jgi:hypothetical protein
VNTDTPRFYVIRLEGILDETWAEWFDGMTLSWPEDAPGETRLSGYVVDQPALHGVLERIRDLNLNLLAVEQKQPPS